ncbi:MAG TPA: DUF748 domain-containing protein [Syntrophobacteria bacterium]|nr:DUF748 domain-containing protein [archaeon]HYA02888.1 DUF748 domain-containing protein [Syntrophobacteria bacterium]
MTSAEAKKWGMVAVIVVLVLGVGAIIGFRSAVSIVKGKVVEALGPESEIAELKVGWFTVEVGGLRIKGPSGWPVADTLRVERVVIVPSLRSLLSNTIRILSIAVERPYVSALRGRDGKLEVLPSLLGGPSLKGKTNTGPPGRAVDISRLTVEDGVAELFDATVVQPPLKVRLEKIQGTVRNVAVPSLKGKSQFDFTAVVKGVRRDGRGSLTGWAEIASKDSSVKTELRSVDLVAFQPYLSKAAEARIQKGTLDLDLQSDVRNNHLQAPGKVVISDLEFAPGTGTLDSFMGVPRSAVVDFLKNKDNKIAVKFTIEGDINNPQFTLREALATRMASSMAELLGVSIRGVAEDVGTLGRKSVETAGEAAKGLGGALQGIFGSQKKK